MKILRSDKPVLLFRSVPKMTPGKNTALTLNTESAKYLPLTWWGWGCPTYSVKGFYQEMLYAQRNLYFRFPKD